MSESILTNGYPSLEEIRQGPGYPSEERFGKGPVAVAECVQQIPCNPCEAACKHGALIVGEPITNLPKVDNGLCTGCGLCIARCSGLAIFVINKAYSESEATVAFPHEYLPLPEKDQVVTAVNRAGRDVCQGVVLRVGNPSNNDCTPVITIRIPKEYADEVRGMKRLKRGVSNEG